MTSFNLSYSAALKLQLTAATSICEAINSPRSLAVSLLLNAGEFQQYMDLTCNPEMYEDHSAFADDYLVSEIMRKSPYIVLETNREEVATESFWISELQCAYANDRLKKELSSYKKILQLQSVIANMLGPLDQPALDSILNGMGHGPGGCIGFAADGKRGSQKYDTQVSLTVDLYPYYKALMGPLWHDYKRSNALIVPGNRFATVPKDAKTDRGICVEPMLNVFGQKGIGLHIRKRLRYFGVDLRHQQKLNRELASQAWKDSLATIDLSRASDTVCSELVLQLFPEDWVELLSLFRSHRSQIKGDYHELEKWSSMGNGYTFELETIIFLALVRCHVPKSRWGQTSVFGDDIVVPQEYAKAVVDDLEFLGFKVNGKKSFLGGNFFESCGTDWFKGHNVRPFYLKEFSPASPAPLQICNKLRMYLYKRGNQLGSDARFRDAWLSLAKHIPLFWRRCKVPPQAGDVGLLCSLSEAPEVKRHRDGWEGLSYRFVQMKSVKQETVKYSYLLSRLLSGTTPDAPDLWYGRNNVQITKSVVRLVSSYKKANRTLGKEPVKGLYGRCVPKVASVARWPDGLEWDLYRKACKCNFSK
jgi:hypothetical protein